jgi:hypothetical protein
MTQIKAAMEELESALATLAETFGKPARDIGAALTALPALVLGPPIVEFLTPGLGQPGNLRAIVYVVVTFDGAALERLWEYVELVAGAIDAQTAGWVVRQASPSVYPAGATDLPAYEIQCEGGLA